MSKETNREFIERSVHRSKKRYTVVIDETGDPSHTSKDNIYGMGATITDNPEQFGEISRKVRDELGIEEVKHRDLELETKERMKAEIYKMGAEVVGVYIDKNADDNPEWWHRFKGHRSKQHVKLLEELSDDIMSEDKDHLTVIIDEHSALKKNTGSEIIRRSAEKHEKKIDYVKQDRSIDGEHKDLLQTNDIAIGSMGHSLRKGRNDHIIPTKVRRLTKTNSKR